MSHATEVRRAEECMGVPTVASGWYWGRELPDRAVLSAAGDFDARVEQAWTYMKGAFFAAGEHARLRVALVELLGQEALQ